MAGYSYKYSSQGREYIITYTINDSSHVHSLTSVAAKKPTCTASGNIAYYTCGCGKWFKDSAATVEITDKSTVALPSTAHTEFHKVDVDSNADLSVVLLENLCCAGADIGGNCNFKFNTV